MIFEEKDIDFTSISSTDFEELCFDLLWRMGFHSLRWRQGGADSGRDIEGQYNMSTPLTDASYIENWFFECKNHKQGVDVDEISSKISWAEAEKPKHLVIIASPYLTNSTLIWLEKRTKDAYFRVHYVDGKTLKKLLLNYPDIIAKFFTDKYGKLLSDSMKTWRIHGILPDLETLYVLWSKMDTRKLKLEEMAFLLASYLSKDEEYLEWSENSKPDFSFEHLTDYLARKANIKEPILSVSSDIGLPRHSVFETYALWHGGMNLNLGSIEHVTFCELMISENDKKSPAMYCYLQDELDRGVEILIFRREDFVTLIRHIPNGAWDDMKEMRKILQDAPFEGKYTKE